MSSSLEENGRFNFFEDFKKNHIVKLKRLAILEESIVIEEIKINYGEVQKKISESLVLKI